MKFPRLLLTLIVAQVPLVAVAQQKKADPPVAAGEPQVSNCIGCHSIPGYQASFPEVYRVPKIGGQSEQYLIAALRAYKQGERNHPTMAAVARSLTDEQIAAVAAYYAQRGRAGQ